MNPEVTIAILTFIAFSIPIVGGLWRVFSVREKLQTQFLNLSHRLDLIESNIENLTDKQTLTLNGLREVIEHVRLRSQTEEKQLSNRLLDVEGWLEKNTEFNRRHG